MKYKKRPTFIEAFQWFEHGDVNEVIPVPINQNISINRREKVGWLSTPQGGHVVFPGDWIIIDPVGNVSSCNSRTFNRLYELAEPYVGLSRYSSNER